MKQGLMLAILFIFSAFILLSGCTSKGTLNINNNTNGQITVSTDGTESIIESGESTHEDWQLSDWLLNHESQDITVSGNGDYKIYFISSFEIKPDKEVTLNVAADAGRFCIHNNSIYPITDVYMATPGSQDWGYDWLSSSIKPGESRSWQVLPGYHCFAAVDTFGDYWIVDWVRIVEDIDYDYYLYYGDVAGGNFNSISSMEIPDYRR